MGNPEENLRRAPDMFSIYILTYNEELDIAACIESALLSDDVIVVDSCSSDRTVEIASRYPANKEPGCSKISPPSTSGFTF
jgi:glycosyltransferase involved in cell wall biosynthesis